MASKCGLTPQYTGLEDLQKRYADQGFTVLGVPCNQFGGQEPGTADEIQTFCSTTYGVTFPLTEKVDVNGQRRHPLYDLLTATPDAEGRGRRHPVEFREVPGLSGWRGRGPIPPARGPGLGRRGHGYRSQPPLTGRARSGVTEPDDPRVALVLRPSRRRPAPASRGRARCLRRRGGPGRPPVAGVSVAVALAAAATGTGRVAWRMSWPPQSDGTRRCTWPGRPSFDRIAGFPVHRGVLALAERQPALDPTTSAGRRRTVVVVEGVNDHENLGAIFRNAAAFGAGAVLLDPTCCDPLYRRSVRVSVGHVLRVPFARLTPWPAALADLAAAGFDVVALDPAAPDTIESVQPGRRVAVLVGAEGSGLSAACGCRWPRAASGSRWQPAWTRSTWPPPWRSPFTAWRPRRILITNTGYMTY